MNGLIYLLKLREPVLANSLAGDTNSARSLHYVPGGLVRGALINNYRLDKNAEASNDEFRRFFLSNETRYLHAYPWYGNERDSDENLRALPTPLAWKVPKATAAGSTTRATQVFNLAQTDSEEHGLTGVKFDLWWRDGNEIRSPEIAVQFNVHTQRDAIRGRAKEDLGAVFRYEALPAGLLVCGIILTANKQDAEEIKKLLRRNGGELLLGKARTAGYGRASVEKVEDLGSEWREGRRWVEKKRSRDEEGDEFEEFQPPAAVQNFRLTFLSEALLRDEHGQLTLDPLPALKARLGVENLSATKVFRAAEIVGGFNRKWGLPLPQVTAIAAGSVFVLKSETPIVWETLCKLEETGVGERRTEGFGRVSIDIDQPETIDWKKSDAKEDTSREAGLLLTGASERMAKLMLRRLLHRELEQKVMAAVRKHPIDTTIPNSQLSHWRVIIRSARGERDLAQRRKRIFDFLAHEKEKQSRPWRQMQRARVKETKDLMLQQERRQDTQDLRLTDWLEKILHDEISLWKMLECKEDAAPARKLGEAVKYEVDEALKLEYKLRLIDAMLAARAKKNAEEQKQRGAL